MPVSPEKRKEILSKLVGDSGIKRLYIQQLQSLREYYGRRYEAIIEQLEIGEMNNLSNSDSIEMKEQKDNTMLAEAAESVTDEFRMVAENAIPSTCKRGYFANIDGGFNYSLELGGLIRDMMEATSEHMTVLEEWEDANLFDDEEVDDTKNGSDDRQNRRNRGPIRWYEKLGSKVLMFAVNYLQGWLALEDIRKAAADRDRKMPKFPLF